MTDEPKAPHTPATAASLPMLTSIAETAAAEAGDSTPMIRVEPFDDDEIAQSERVGSEATITLDPKVLTLPYRALAFIVRHEVYHAVAKHLSNRHQIPRIILIAALCGFIAIAIVLVGQLSFLLPARVALVSLLLVPLMGSPVLVLRLKRRDEFAADQFAARAAPLDTADRAALTPLLQRPRGWWSRLTHDHPPWPARAARIPFPTASQE